MPEIAQIFTGESCKPNRRIPLNVKLLGPYKGHVWAILGPCFGYYCNIFASRCPKWLKFSLKSHAFQIGDYLQFSIIGTIFGPGFGHILAQIFTEESCMPNKRLSSMFT